MDDIDRLARVTVGRLCLYAAVAIAAAMAALSFNLRLAFQVGGILTLSLALLLVYKASAVDAPQQRRPNFPEVAGGLAPSTESHLRGLVVSALRQAYFSFASRACVISGGLLCVSLALSAVP